MPQNINNGGMRKNTNDNNEQQQPPEAMNRLKQKQQLRGLGKSKSQKVSKSSKNSRDGYYKYSMSIRYNSGDTIANLNGLNNDDDLLPPIQVSFDILFDNNDKGDSSSLVEDGDAIKGHGSESKEDAFSSFTDRPGRGQDDDNEEEEEGSDSTLATTTTTADQEVSTTSTETINGEFPTTTTTTTTTTNSTNVEVLNNWEINPIGRTSAIAAAGLISLVSFGSVLFVSVGVYIHAKRSKTAATAAAAAALAGGAAANNNENNVEDGSVDASSIWSANEGGDVAGGGGGQPMSPQPAGVSSIAAIGMASPLALQLSGRTFD